MKIIVHYWIGTTPHSETVDGAVQALRLANKHRHQNGVQATFTDEEGEELHYVCGISGTGKLVESLQYALPLETP